MKQFKEGDKVYIPMLSTKVLVVTIDAPWRKAPYPIDIFSTTFTIDGKIREDDKLPLIFPATEKNHALLEELYGVEFEKPHRKALGNEIVQAMLARGDKYVPCWLSDGHQCPNSAQETDFVTAIADDLSYVTTVTGVTWNYATPFDPRTLEPITELPQ